MWQGKSVPVRTFHRVCLRLFGSNGWISGTCSTRLFQFELLVVNGFRETEQGDSQGYRSRGCDMQQWQSLVIQLGQSRSTYPFVWAAGFARAQCRGMRRFRSYIYMYLNQTTTVLGSDCNRIQSTLFIQGPPHQKPSA